MSSPYERNCLTNLIYGAAEIDVAALEYEISTNWGFIFAIGVVNVLGGIFALLSPTATTMVAMTFLTSSMILMGIINIFGVCYVESCYRLKSLLGGTCMLLLGILMATHVIQSMLVLSSLVAALFMVEGLFRFILAIKNRDMPGWSLGLASGICAIVFSITVIAALPGSAASTLGILLGVNWLTYGFHRIALGMRGRATANEALTGPGDYHPL